MAVFEKRAFPENLPNDAPVIGGNFRPILPPGIDCSQFRA
jgi:hypothetical protein